MSEHVAKENIDSQIDVEELTTKHEVMQQKAERKRLESFWWAAVLIWAGIIFLADYLGILPEVGEASSWSWIFLGAGLFGFLGALVRVVLIDLPRPSAWDVVWATVFVIIGASGFFGGDIAFPIVLLVLGIVILTNVLFRRD